MLWRVCRFLAGVALLPVCAGMALALARLAHDVQAAWPPVPDDAWWLAGGFAAWVLMYALLPRPVRSYVLAHELTHALWAWAMGARDSNMKVGEDSGSVTLSKTNFLILLAPYFFPLYAVLLVALYGVLGLFYDVGRYHLWWMGMLGMAWGFHATFTVATLLQKQSDIRSCGRLFSFAFIVLMNLLAVGLWAVAVTDATLEAYVGHVGNAVHETFLRLDVLLSEAVNALR